MLPWLISGVISWIVLIIFADFRQFNKTVFGGLFAAVLATVVDWLGQSLNLYQFNDLIIPWAGSSVFYIFGTVFVVGVLFTQYLPKSKVLQLFNIIVVSTLFLLFELVLLETPAAVRVNWNSLGSFLINIGALTALTYFAQNFNLAPNFRKT